MPSSSAPLSDGDAAPPEEVPASAALVRRALGVAALVIVLALVVSVLPGLQEVRDRSAGQTRLGSR